MPRIKNTLYNEEEELLKRTSKVAQIMVFDQAALSEMDVGQRYAEEPLANWTVSCVM